MTDTSVTGTSKTGTSATDRRVTANPADTAWRTVEPLVMEVTGAKIAVHSPRVPGRRLRVTPAVARLLLAARTGVPADADPGAVARLIELGFLVKADGDGKADWPVPWRDWGVTAWSFHEMIRATRFVTTEPADVEKLRELIHSRPMPPTTRAPADDRILLLPRVRTRMRIDFQEVLEGRRTHRHFQDAPVPLQALSDLLHYGFAPLRFADAGEMGVLQLRAAASGGARHEAEAFVCVMNVDQVEPGLYHYDNIRHGLVPVNPTVGRDDLEHLTFGQGFFRHAAFGILSVAVADRMSWKYPHPVAYRMLLQNVGHLAQVVSMTAYALGLGAALTGAIRTADAERLLELDTPREFVTFAFACGIPVLRPDGLPVSIWVPSRPTSADGQPVLPPDHHGGPPGATTSEDHSTN